MTAPTSPRIRVYIAASLDGYIATTDDDLTWLESAGEPGTDYGFADFVGAVDLVAMGRGTYDYIADLEPLPYQDRPIEVFTHNPGRPRPGVSFVADSPREAAHRWAAAGIGAVYVDGGQLISQFLDDGLVADLTVTVIPVLLGAGRPLFHRIARSTALELLDVRRFPGGLVQLSYRCTPEIEVPRRRDQEPR